MPEQLPTPGRIIHVRIGGPDEYPTLRPAIVTQCWGPACCNATVFLDPGNDGHRNQNRWGLQPPLYALDPHAGGALAYGMSLSMGDEIGQWRWPARS